MTLSYWLSHRVTGKIEDGFHKRKQEWVIYEGMTSLKLTFASAVVIECTFPVCAVLHFSPQPGMPGCLCVPSYNLKLRCQKPLKLSYLGKARIEWREKRGRKRAKGGQRWNKLLARIGRQKQDKKEEERQTWEGKGRWGWMERFGRMAWKGERQVGEGEGGKYVTKRVWNTMESLKIKDRDEEERRRGGIWWGSKEMRWEKVEGWRVAGGIWAGWIKSCESLSPSARVCSEATWPNEFHDSLDCYTWTSRINMLIMHNP